MLSDEVNEREVLYKSDGTLLKIVPWNIYQNGAKIMNPEYPTYQYWNVQGYTPEGNVWIEIGGKYALKSPTGQLIKTVTTRPAELGTVTKKSLGNGQYKITVTYPDKQWCLISEKAAPMYSYKRDANGNLYGLSNNQIVRYTACGKEIAKLIMPQVKYQPMSLPPDWPPNAEPPKRQILDEYGSPVLSPTGDVYTWKRTPETYSILKWTWVDDPTVQTGPDAPTNLAVAASINGLYLTWAASPQDPGCVTGYEIAQATASGGPYTTIATVNAGVLKYNDTSAAAGTTYYYKVRAVAGTDYSAYTSEVSGKR